MDNKLIDEISLYDKELMTRLVEEIVKFSHGEKFNDKEFVGRYSFKVLIYNIVVNIILKGSDSPL